MFIDLLVRARPKWILEHLQFGRWTEAVWREAFERRFLRSWRRFKGEGDTWRAVFLRRVNTLIMGRKAHDTGYWEGWNIDSWAVRMKTLGP